MATALISQSGQSCPEKDIYTIWQLLMLMLALLAANFFAFKLSYNIVGDVSSLLVRSKLDTRCYPSRNWIASSCKFIMCYTYKFKDITACIHLVKFSLAAGYFVCLANDVNLNPGPTASCLICPRCDKVIRGNQARLHCTSCELDFRLKCLGAEYDQTRCYCLYNSLSHNLTQLRDLPASASEN